MKMENEDKRRALVHAEQYYETVKDNLLKAALWASVIETLKFQIKEGMCHEKEC